MMKRIYTFMVLLSLAAVSVNAQDRLSTPYLKVKVHQFLVESTDDSWSYYVAENIGGGETYYNSGVDSYDLEGDGLTLEIGIGSEVLKGLYLEGSLFCGYASLDGEVVDQGYEYVTDGGGITISENRYGGQWGESETTLAVAGCIVDVNYDVAKLFDPQSKLSVIGGVGLGLSYNLLNDVEVTGYDGSTSEFEGAGALNLAWRLNLGVSYSITESLSMNLTYQYMDLGTAESGKTFTADDGGEYDFDNLEFDVTAHTVGIGLSYSF